LRHMHSVLAVCGLPYRQLPSTQRDYRRQQGNMAITVTSGMLDDDRGNPHLQPVPFGPKARLILLHLCSEAIRQKSPRVEIADSFTAFVRDMGYPDSGGVRGPMTAFKTQLNALAACTMRLSVWTQGRVSMRHITPIESLDLWLPSDHSQRTLWPSTVTFSPTMFESLTRHALPVNIHAVRALAGSARKLDLYFWLSYRMSRLETPLQISWEALADQFGHGYAQLRQFRAAFREDFDSICELLPSLPARLSEVGIALQPADLSALALPATNRR
jgi:Plasmid encoded RepA protein